MTREQTVDLVRSIVSIYPNWKPENLTDTVNAWFWALEEYPAPAIKGALQIYVKTNNSGFAPSVSQLIAAMYKPVENEQLSEAEAWDMVKRALQDSAYHAAERFEELPDSVKKAVGSANMLQQWARTDIEEVNSVIMSNFQRAYRTVAERERFSQKVPEKLSGLVKGLVQKTSGEEPKLIQTNDKKYVHTIGYLDHRDNTAKIFKTDTDDAAQALVNLKEENQLGDKDFTILTIDWGQEE